MSSAGRLSLRVCGPAGTRSKDTTNPWPWVFSRPAGNRSGALNSLGQLKTSSGPPTTALALVSEAVVELFSGPWWTRTSVVGRAFGIRSALARPGVPPVRLSRLIASETVW